MASLRASLRLLGFLGIIAIFFVPVGCCHVTGLEAGRWWLLRRFYRLGAFIFGVRIEAKGEMAQTRPLLLVSNHCAYLDIPVLGSLLPVGFTPKREVRNWPLIGILCVLAGCVFIDRQRSKTKLNQKNLQEKLQTGAVLSLFPEGTTGDGSAVLPFRSSYFSLAQEQHLPIQPVTVQYLRRDGSPFTREEMDGVAWFGDAEFVPHLWEYFKTGGARAQLTFHPLVTESFSGRKELAAYCQAQVASAYMPMLSADKKRGAPEGAPPNNGG